MKILTIIFILSALLFGCSSNNSNSKSESASPSPIPKPTLTKEEVEKQEKAELQEKQKSIDEFVARNYKGWILEGIASNSFSDGCDESLPCDLHLINGKQSKVITVILRQFYKTDQSTYWFVREAKPVDLSKARIEEIKSKYLDGLSADDVPKDLRDAIIENAAE